MLAVLVAGAGAAIVFGFRARTNPAPKIVVRIASATRGKSDWQIKATAFNRSSSVFITTNGQAQFRLEGQWQDVWNPNALAGVKTDVLPPEIGLTNHFRIPIEASHVRVRWAMDRQSWLGIQAAWICWRLGLRPESHPTLWKLLDRLPNNRDGPHEITSDKMLLPPPVEPTVLRVGE